MRLLLAGHKGRFSQLREFGNALEKLGVENKLVQDIDVYDGFPSRNLRNWFQTSSKFRKLINEFEPDAVFVDRQRHFGLAAIKEKLPLFMFLRGDYWSEIEWARKTLYRLPHKRLALWRWDQIAKKSFEGSKIILPVSSYLEGIVKTHYPHKETEVLYHGIDPTLWHSETGMNLKHPCVGLLQNATILGKTMEMLTLAKVMDAIPDVMFYWAGDGPYRNIILPILEKYKNFKWLGQLNYPDEVRKFLSEIDVYALVSGYDMLPMTVIQAEMMEKPVVATNIGGTPEEMINNETGFLIEKGDYHDWIKKITLLINDQNMTKKMGQTGHIFAKENFSWEIIAKKFVNILNFNLD